MCNGRLEEFLRSLEITAAETASHQLLRPAVSWTRCNRYQSSSLAVYITDLYQEAPVFESSMTKLNSNPDDHPLRIELIGPVRVYCFLHCLVYPSLKLITTPY